MYLAFLYFSGIGLVKSWRGARVFEEFLNGREDQFLVLVQKSDGEELPPCRIIISDVTGSGDQNFARIGGRLLLFAIVNFI